MTIQPWPIVEKAIRELVEDKYAPADGHAGGAPSYEAGDDIYVWISRVPGGGSDEISGEWIVDIDCFAPTFGEAMTHANALEAIFLARMHSTSVMNLDRTRQNESPTERPWDDESVSRVGATYVFTARRSG